MIGLNSEVLIHSGMHQWQHGVIEHIETATEIPFAQVALRGSKGQVLQRSGAYVPLKYCVELDKETCDAVAAQYKAARKRLRAAEKAAAKIAPPAQDLSWQ